MKIAVYSICKNEAAFVERYLNSCIGADLVVVADTGSTDGTQNEFARRQAGPTPIALHQIALNPWRFDTARNVALSLVPADVDVCIRLDLDEVLDPGWRPALEDAWIEGTTQLWYWFNHAPSHRFRTNNIHARFGFHWKYADHEGLYYINGQSRIRDADDRLSITHLQDHSKDRTGILPRLIKSANEEKCARTLYYLCREYHYYGMSIDTIRTALDYLKQPDAIWDQERMDVMSFMAEAYERLGDFSNAYPWWYKCIAECPSREPFLGLARLALKTGNYELAAGTAAHALKIKTKLESIHYRHSAWNGELEQICRTALSEMQALRGTAA